ncbi:hypothetical protein BC831DRAFT_147398 [Entophlyctis helioformis]|nr:hypothetical protein BC831DRAFT_147398 [Entophlyctis helioformis]
MILVRPSTRQQGLPCFKAATTPSRASSRSRPSWARPRPASSRRSSLAVSASGVVTAALSNAALHLIGGKRSPTSSGPASESGEPTGDVNNEPTQGKTRVGSIGDAMGSGGLGHAGEIANANTSSGKVSQHNLQQAQSRSHSQSTPSRPSTSTARHSETGTDGPSVPGAAMGSLTGLSGQPTSAVADAAQQPSESSPKAAHLRQVLLRTAQHPATAHSRADSHDPARRSPLAMTVRNADEAQSINSLASSAASSDLESKGHSYAAANAHRASFSGFASPDSLNNSLTIPSTTQTLTRRSDPEHNHHSSQQQQQQQQQDQDQSVTESGPATTTSSALAVTGLSIATSSAVNPLSVQPSVVKSLSTPRISVSNSDNLTPSFVIHPASPSSPSHPDYAGDFPDEAGESAGMQGDYSGSGLPAEDDTDYDYVDPLQQADPTAQHSAGASNASNTSSHSSAGKRSIAEPGGNMDAANMPAPAIPPHLAPTLSTSSMSRDDLRPSQVEGRLHDVGRAATQSQPPPSPSGGLFDLPEQFRHIVVAVDAPIPTPTPLHLRGHLDQLHSQLQSGSQMNLVGANGSAGIVPVNVLPVGLVRHQQHQQHQSSQANLSTLAQGASASGGIVASRSMQMQMQTPAYRPPGQNMSAESTMSVASPTQRAPAAGPPGSAMGDTMQPFSYDPLQTAAAGVLTIVDSAVGPPTRSIQVHVTEKQQQQNKETAAAEQERSAPSSPLGSSNGHTHVAPTPATTSMIGMSSLNGHEATVAGNGGAGSGGAGGRGHASSTRSGGGSSSSSNRWACQPTRTNRLHQQPKRQHGHRCRTRSNHLHRATSKSRRCWHA